MIYSHNNIQYLDHEELEAILSVIREEWPKNAVIVRDENALDSALHRPLNSYANCLLEIAAMYFESFVFNHPLIDGNKRLGYFSVSQFLGNNGHELIVDDDEAYAFIMPLIQDPPFKKEVFKAWLSAHTVPPIYALPH